MFFKIFKIFIINFFITIILFEILLNLYNPLGFRIKGNEIILENNIVRHLKVNNREIYHTKNSLGFRGPELTNKDITKIISVGGSTTENFFHDDKKTWTYLLSEKINKTYSSNFWFNNAGLDGHSTFGHIILIKDYISKIKPDVILFLIGANDVWLDKENDYDSINIFNFNNLFKIGNQRSYYRNIINYLAIKSETASLILNLYRYYIKTNQGHLYNLQNYELIANQGNNEFKEYNFSQYIEERNILSERFIPQYNKRLERIIKLSKSNNFIPIFITQPTILGSNAEKNLENKKISKNDKSYLDLKSYNDATRLIAKKHNIHLIDLSYHLEQNRLYYKDSIHFTESGINEVSNIIYEYFIKNCKTILKNCSF